MSAQKKLATLLLGVGVSQLCLFPFHKKYQERSHAQMQAMLAEHRTLIAEAQARLNQSRPSQRH